MDSPESRQIAASTSSSSLTVQESSFSSYVSSLSPIKPVRLLHFSNFLSRSSAGSTSPDIDLSQEESFPRRREDEESLDDLGQSSTQFNVGSVPCPEEEVQCTSVCLSGEVADTVMVDSLSSPDIPLKAASNPHEVLKSPLTNSQESIIVVGAKHTETEANVALASSKEAHDELFADITYIPSRSVMDLVDSDSDLVQTCQQFMDLNGGINQHDWDCIPLACFGLMNNANMSEMLDKVSRPTKGFEEASQFQGGTGRQLEFEAAMACRDVATVNNYRKTEGINMDNSRSPFTPTSLESHISFLKEIGGHSRSVLQVSHVPSKILQLPLCANKTFQGCPGGNGIHLDSIGETVTTCSNAITDIKSSGCLKPHPVDIKPIKQCTKLIEEKISVSEDAQRIVDQHQMTFRKKRKPAMQNIESEGCKRCSCKKSKCLKLYCECFAAGVYCAADTCTCENCFNKEEYEDTVLDIRQQIESRNPLAFTPKIVKQVPEPSSSISDQGIHMAPSSARHKRGCYCKKSKCLKKYCECNQAKVGCSDGCRCEDCQNTFGLKPVCVSAEGSEGPPKEKLGSVDTGTYIVDNSQFPGNGVREMVSTEQELNCSKPGREYESMPSWEVFADLNHFTPISDPPSEFSHLVSPNAMNLTEGPLSQETNPHSSDGSLHCLSLPISFTPQLCKTKDLSELGYYTPNEAICTSIPIEDENKVPLNLKGRPPQFYQVQESMSSSLLAEKGACNFLLQPAPSFPNFILHGDPKKEQFNQK